VRPVDAEASSFLDRERALLGEDADQFTTPQDRTATVEEDDGDDFMASAPAHLPQDDMLDFESDFPAIDSTNAVSLQHPNFDQMLTHQNVGPSGLVTGTPVPMSSYSAPEPDSEHIIAWREKRDAEIAKREQISADKKASTIAEARQAIDDFYESYNDKKEKNIAQTRREADEFLEKRDDTTAGGTAWDRISKLVDLSGKGAKGGAAASGKERFREMLVSLRKDENAPGAKGI